MWILIIAMLSLDGNTITTQEFNSEDSCKAAKFAVETFNPYRGNGIQAVCVFK